MRIFKLLILLIFSINFGLLNAQESRTVVLKTSNIKVVNYNSNLLEIEPIEQNPFVAFSVAVRGENLLNSISQLWYKDAAGTWIPFPKEEHYISDQAWNAMVFLDPSMRQTEFRITFNQATVITSAKANFYYPKDSEALIQSPSENAAIEKNDAADDCGCAKPTIIPRSTWCPTNNCPPNTSPQATDVKFLIVHHTAGSNSSSDWAAVVRSIWNLHVNTNGWADIGYNFLIDTNGQLYQGRADDTRGAHFSGQNSETSGMALMGNFSTSNPSTTMITALQNLLVWKACDKNLNPIGTAFHNSSGKTLNTISGHRDGGPTECPGDRVYAMLPDIRTDVDSQLASCKLSIDDFDNPYFNVSPNPFGDELRIQPKQGAIYEFALYSILGQEIMKKTNINEEVILSTQQLGSGVYVLKIYDGSNTIQLKVLKK